MLTKVAQKKIIFRIKNQLNAIFARKLKVREFWLILNHSGGASLILNCHSRGFVWSSTLFWLCWASTKVSTLVYANWTYEWDKMLLKLVAALLCMLSGIKTRKDKFYCKMVTTIPTFWQLEGERSELLILALCNM